MVELKNKLLFARNARDKIQQVEASLSQDGGEFIIKRITGQYQGKLTEQPELIITEGKAKRTPLEQAEQEYNSIVNRYLNRGYKELESLTSKKFDDITPNELDTLVPSVKSDASGFLKPMLAKDSNKVQTSVLNKPFLCSRKLDGVRAMFQLNDDGEIVAISRGGTDYNIPTTLIRDELKEYFKNNPEIILDGELYHHGYHLQEISGIARLKSWEDRCKILEYHIYDIGSSDLKFSERLTILNQLKEEFKNFNKVKVLDHIETNSYLEMKKLHDLWVSEGYEGLVARKPNSKYGFGKRGSDMIKVKVYKEAEFEIIDYKDGLRDEDFVFVCQTEDGKSFEAKPMGDRELKAQYIEDIDKIIGKMGTVKFFDWSKDGIPMQTVFKTIRDYE